LRQRVALVGRLPIPLEGFGVIVGHAFAHDIEYRQAVLRWRMALLGSATVPFGGFRVVAWNALAGFI